MSDHEYQPGVPCWVDAMQPDPEASKQFYGDLFGWTFEGSGDEEGEYFVARVNGSDVAGIGTQPSPETPPLWSTYVQVASADAAAARVERAGGRVIVAPVDAMPAGRLAIVADPAGATFGLWEPGIRDGAQLVNAPSAWSMSQLTTPDSDGAAAFYGEVFGWETEEFAMGDMKGALLRLPGYVGGTATQPVPRDVVAVMFPAGPDAPPAWSVDFWVADIDAAVATATAGGGSVVAPVFDTGVGRSAVLTDPQGAVFGVTQIGSPSA